jgi:hypothetical protein
MYPQNLIRSFHTICQIVTFIVEKKVFSSVPKGYNSVLGAKNPYFEVGVDQETLNSYS